MFFELKRAVEYRVVTEPPGATIILGGKPLKSQTPITLPGATGGSHRNDPGSSVNRKRGEW